ncbi:bucky ball [Diretmus argenteus]
MDDGGNHPHPFGNGQGQPRAQHPRPFFYVQPPSQPYYMYQHWHVNNPYNHYGLPGGYNLGRPYMHPYPYMQYPGFVVPPAQMHPMEYRRMFEPRFHSPPWNDTFRQQPHPQAYGRREMACSEVQTDPSDAITKLIECLDKIRANELAAERELDSGVASQTSGVFSPRDETKSEGQSTIHVSSAPEGNHLQSPAVAFSDSTTAVYDGESSQRSLEDLSPPGCWSVGFDEELPLDSSSLHEECPGAQQLVEGGQFLLHHPPEKLRLSENPNAEVLEIQSDVSPNVPKCSIAEELLKQRLDAIMPSTQSSAPRSSSNQTVLKDTENGDKISKTEYQTESPGEAEVDPSYRILKLPFDSALTAAALLKESNVLYEEQPTTLPPGCISSSAPPYYYSYLATPTSHERMSVLSPSLDELSSRDEMFSTDLEDMDRFPKCVYTNRRLAEVVGGSPQAAAGGGEVWPAGVQRFMCACCGTSLAKGASRSNVPSSKLYGDEGGDSDEESRYGRSCEHPARVVGRKPSVSRKPHSLSLRQVSKPGYKRHQYKDPTNTVGQDEGHDLSKEKPAGGETGEIASSEQQWRTCQDRPGREDVTVSDQGRWEDGDVKPRRRQPTPMQRQEMNTPRKVPCKSLMYHRARDEEKSEEPPQFHWERGELKHHSGW